MGAAQEVDAACQGLQTAQREGESRPHRLILQPAHPRHHPGSASRASDARGVSHKPKIAASPRVRPPPQSGRTPEGHPCRGRRCCCGGSLPKCFQKPRVCAVHRLPVAASCAVERSARAPSAAEPAFRSNRTHADPELKPNRSRWRGWGCAGGNGEDAESKGAASCCSSDVQCGRGF